MSRRSTAFRNQLLGDFSETDLNKLRLQYHRSEAAKRAYAVKTQSLFCRDKREIQRLQDERDELLRNLGVSQSFSNCLIDAGVVQDLTATLAHSDRIDEKLRAEKGEIASLRDQILTWERKLAGQRTDKRTTRRIGKSDNSNVLKNIGLIENKLHRGRKCFNELMSRNAQLKEELKTLQVEKKHFLHVRSLLEKEIHAIRKDVCNLMTKCTEAFNASVKVQEKQRTLTDQNTRDVAQYFKEKGSFEREISHHRNFETLLDTKAIVRISQDFNHRKVETCRQLGSKEWTLADFENAIKEISRETAESDLDNLVRNFIQMEAQNYTLLNFVNYQHNEAETIRRQISQLHSEREKLFAEEQQQQEQQQALRVRVSIRQDATEQQLAVHQRRVQLMEELLSQLKEGVKSLLQISGDSSGVFDQSDQDEKVPEGLRMVEDRVGELLALQSYLHFQDSQRQWDSLSAIAGQLLGISPPSVGLTSAAAPAPDNDQDSVEPVLLEGKELLSREDLLALVDRRIQRKKMTE